MAPYNDKTAVNKKKDTNDASQAKPENNQDSKAAITVEPENSMAKHSIYFVGGEKGGVGKSFFTRCMLDYFIARGWNDEFALIEADPTINDVSSVYDEDCEKVIFSDKRFGNDEPNAIVDKAIDKTVVVNMPSNVSRQFHEWSKKIGLLSPELKAYCGNITYFFISDGCYQSIQQFLSHINRYPPEELPLCLILNIGRLTSGGSFIYLEEYEDLMKAIKLHKIPVLQMLALDTSVQFESDRRKLTYRQLCEQVDKYSYKQNANSFVKLIDGFFNQIFPNNIRSPEGLSNIVEAQEKYRKKKKLSILYQEKFN